MTLEELKRLQLKLNVFLRGQLHRVPHDVVLVEATIRIDEKRSSLVIMLSDPYDNALTIVLPPEGKVSISSSGWRGGEVELRTQSSLLKFTCDLLPEMRKLLAEGS